jgi:hypothetical protein
VLPALPNTRWSIDFVHDQLASGRRFRVLNLVDDVTKECLAAVADTSISSRRVARELTALVTRHGRPTVIVPDHGTEFASNAMLAWGLLIKLTYPEKGPRRQGGPEKPAGLGADACTSPTRIWSHVRRSEREALSPM